MQSLVTVWSALSPARRVFVAVATLAMFGAVLLLSRAATTPSLALLYSGLEASAAGDVVAALEQRGVAYEVRGNAIFADSSQRDQLRLTLAADGLPANGGQGYELLDNLSGFGTTAQMFDAAYWRAKEGELARTISASPGIRSARVHIATPPGQSFRRDVMPSASVALTPASGPIGPDQARAVRFLVASAVAGLSPDAVSVIDATSGRVLGAEDPSAGIGSGPDRAAELRRNVERLLEAYVGPGKAVVEVSVETLTEREQITERRFDPESRVAISSETEERTSQATDSRQNGVTVASNLPDGDAQGGAGQSSERDSETRQRTNYEVSETQREILKSPGGIRRITVAVLVDGLVQADASGVEAWAPRSEDQIAAIGELVRSAVGFDEARGDVVTVRSLPFEPASVMGTDGSGAGLIGSISGGFNVMSLIQLAVLAIVALILGLFVVRPILAPRALPSPRQLDGSGDRLALGVDGEMAPVLDGEIDDGLPTMNLPMASGFPMMAGMGGFEDGDGAAEDDADPVKRLRKLISERQAETTEILRNWMEDRGERT